MGVVVHSLRIETPRLVLRPHTAENAALLNAWHNDPELIYYDDDQPDPPPPYPMERTVAFLERTSTPTLASETIHWAVHLKEPPKLIGYCMAAYIDQYHRKCRFGMTIGDRAEWGKGYGREVVEAVTEFLFTKLDLNRIQCEIYDFNERSIRLFESAGFRREGVCRQAVLKRGRFADEYVYGLLREDWMRHVSLRATEGTPPCAGR